MADDVLRTLAERRVHTTSEDDPRYMWVGGETVPWTKLRWMAPMRLPGRERLATVMLAQLLADLSTASLAERQLAAALVREADAAVVSDVTLQAYADHVRDVLARDDALERVRGLRKEEGDARWYCTQDAGATEATDGMLPHRNVWDVLCLLHLMCRSYDMGFALGDTSLQFWTLDREHECRRLVLCVLLSARTYPHTTEDAYASFLLRCALTAFDAVFGLGPGVPREAEELREAYREYVVRVSMVRGAARPHVRDPELWPLVAAAE